MPDQIPVDVYYETENEEFEPYEFECNINDLASNDYKLELVKSKIMRQILLEMKYDDEFTIHPEISKQYKS